MSIKDSHVKIKIMKKILIYQIDDSTEHQTIEHFLRARGYSKHLIIRLRGTELGITVNGVLAYTTHKLTAGENLTIRLIETESSEHIIPVPMDIDIVFEDEDLMVINKAANVPIHPSQGNYDCTLANGIAYYYQQKGEAFVYRAINRLDRDTTGLLILAKHQLSASILSKMVQERNIHREYLAIAHGITERGGTITAPIARVDGSTIERCVDFDRGEFARTHYRLIHTNSSIGCSLITLKLETGRTHQIRVHMKHIGHPLLGDFLYNPDYRFIHRQALHSYRLTFPHPLSGKTMQFEAPLPEDMQFLL